MENFLVQTSNVLITIYPPLYILALIVSIVFVISGITDLYFDLSNIFWKLRRWILGGQWKPITLDRLKAREQQRVAIFIAAWHEEDVIARTLQNAVETIQYKNYDIFIGTYPNDPDTQREVDKVAQKYPRVHKVVTPDPGPTNKASNLNHVFNALIDFETKNERYFDFILMHDSEDVIHPYSLLVYNFLIPRMELIQIPVYPIALPLKEVTHWTYADEFAENHIKIMRVREITGGFVPSAGVGTAFTKRAFQRLAMEDQEIFSPNSLTEDYQLGLRMNLRGMKAAFVNIKLPSPQSSENVEKGSSEWVATRALFPTQFKRAVKQKTRWNIGIVLQGWENIGWKGSLAVNWNLFQDRKALITAPVNFLAYFVFLYFLVYQAINYFMGFSMPVLIPAESLLALLVLIATVFMVWRSLNRAVAVNRIYGFLPALSSIPRVVWGNVINFFAIIRALYQYFINKIRKKEVAWDKTAHEFPAGVAENVQDAVDGISSSNIETNWLSIDLKPQNLIRLFTQRIEESNDQEKISLLGSLPQERGDLLFPHFIHHIYDPNWEIRAAVCRSLSFLQLTQAIPYLKQAAGDEDWVVRSNAVRALGKLGEQGEKALINLLYTEDKYARDAARTVLEQQGFLERRIKEVNHPDPNTAQNAWYFIKILAEVGESELAQDVLNFIVDINIPSGSGYADIVDSLSNEKTN